MHVRIRATLAALAASGCALAAGAVPGVASAAVRHSRPAASQASCPWLNQSEPISTRVSQLMAKMTLQDEITLVEGHGSNNPYVFYEPAIPSLCIPQLGEEDGPAGVADGLTGVTQLPAGVDLAATFSPSLARKYGEVVGNEEWGKGAAVNLGPTVNLDRDPRWGRSFEAFSEDPFLNGSLATSEIDGVQSQGELSQIKHYDDYDQETNRNTPQDNEIIAQRPLHELYLASFETAIARAHAASVMCSYATINGNPECQDNALENGTLKQDWGFPGFITSDYGALHSTDGILDGTDQEQPEDTYYGAALLAAVQSGQIPRAVVNTSIARVLTTMFRFNLFNDPPTGTTTDTVTTPAHVATATKVAETGATLLKNDDQTLPLSPNHAGTVAVIGPSASATPTDSGGGSAHVISSGSVTPVAGVGGCGPGPHPPHLHAGAADRRLAAGDPGGELDPGVRADAVRRELLGHADRPGDRHVRARDHELVRLLHVDLSEPQRPADPQQPWNPAAGRLLGRGAADRGADVHDSDQRGLVGLDVGDAVGARAADRPGCGRGEVGLDRRGGRLRRHPDRSRRSVESGAAVRTGRADLRGRRRESAHGRGRAVGRPGDDAVAVVGERRARRLVSGAGGRGGVGQRGVRPKRPQRSSAGDVPAEPRAGAGLDTTAVARRRRKRGSSPKVSTSATAGTTITTSRRCSRSATDCPTRRSVTATCRSSRVRMGRPGTSPCRRRSRTPDRERVPTSLSCT